MAKQFLDTPGLSQSWGISKNTFQPILISGVNIKTVNGKSILGAGDLEISAIGSGSVSWDDILGKPSWATGDNISWNDISGKPGWITSQNILWSNVGEKPAWAQNAQGIDWKYILNMPGWVGDLSGTLNGLQDQVNDLDIKVQDLDNRVSEFENLNGTYITQIKKNTQDIAQLGVKIDSFVANTNTKISNMQLQLDQFDITLGKFDDRLDGVQDGMTSLSNRVTIAETRISSITTIVRDLGARLDEFGEQLAGINTDYTAIWNTLNSLPDSIVTSINDPIYTSTSGSFKVGYTMKSGRVYDTPLAKSINIPGATSTKAGLMSAQDKTRLDGIFTGNLELPVPVITGSWTFYNNAGSQVQASSISPTPNATNPVLENGYKARFVGTYKWTHESGKKDPTQVQSGSSWSDLPASGVSSSSYDSGQLTSNKTVKIGIQAEKTGLMVGSNGVDVVPASGMDTTTAQRTVTFQTRIYYGVATGNSVTESVVKSLAGQVLGGKARTLSGVTANASQYYIYAYPSSLGALTTIIQDGATPVLGAFTRKGLKITNAAGISVSLYVYISNNPGAFTNVKLQFQ